MRVQLTVRVEPHTADYIAALATEVTRKTGVRISYSEIGRVLLERAEAEGWQIAPAALTSRPGAPLTIPTPGRDSSQHQEG